MSNSFRLFHLAFFNLLGVDVKMDISHLRNVCESGSARVRNSVRVSVRNCVCICVSRSLRQPSCFFPKY